MSAISEVLDWKIRVAPAASEGMQVSDIAHAGWNLLEGDVLQPSLVLKEHALQHNLSLMADYCARVGVSLAPHAKTPMAPQLVERQLDAGAWGISVANVSQARVMRS